MSLARRCSSEEEVVVGVEQWAEIRRLYFVGRLSIKEIVRRSGYSRNTVRRALRSGEPPRYRRPRRPSKLDPFRDEIDRLLRSDSRLPGKRVRELLEEQGYAGGKTILDDYLREVRPLFLPRPRTFQRTSYRPGVFCQFDLWQPSREIPVGSGQTRRGYVVVGCLPYSRAGAGTLVFSKEAPDLLYGIGDCLAKLGALPETLVWDREGALHAGEGRPTRTSASIPATTRSTRAWSAAASSCASRSGRSSPPASRRASSPAGMPARSRATARSPRSSTPARSGSCAAPRPSRRSKPG